MNVIIATDCGSTTTKAILIEKKDGVYRQTFRGESPTTVEAPFEDVTRGVLNAFVEVEELSGRRILDGEKIITPAEYDLFQGILEKREGITRVIEGLEKVSIHRKDAKNAKKHQK